MVLDGLESRYQGSKQSRPTQLLSYCVYWVTWVWINKVYAACLSILLNLTNSTQKVSKPCLAYVKDSVNASFHVSQKLEDSLGITQNNIASSRYYGTYTSIILYSTTICVTTCVIFAHID